MSEPDFPEELDYATSLEANRAIVRAMADIAFVEKMRRLMPLIAKELVKAGVDFSKAKLDARPPLLPTGGAARGRREE